MACFVVSSHQYCSAFEATVTQDIQDLIGLGQFTGMHFALDRNPHAAPLNRLATNAGE